MNKNSLNRGFTAMILLLTGLLLLLINIGVISLEIKEMFVEIYPILLLLLGLYLFLSYLSRKSVNKLFVCLFLIIYSTLLLVSHFTNLEFNIWNLWPLLIIFIGLKLLFKRTENYEDESDFGMDVLDTNSQKIEDALEYLENGKSKLQKLSNDDLTKQLNQTTQTGTMLPKSNRVVFNQQIEEAWNQINKSQEMINSLLAGAPQKTKQKSKVKTSKMVTMGSVEFNQSNWHLEPMNIYHAIGDYSFDFNKAYIPERTTLIKLKGWIGDVDIIVPEDIPIRVRARISIGEVTIFSSSFAHVFGPSVFFESPQYEEAVKKIDFVIDLNIGDVKIDKV